MSTWTQKLEPRAHKLLNDIKGLSKRKAAARIIKDYEAIMDEERVRADDFHKSRGRMRT